MANSARIDELRKKFDENPRRYFAPLANEYRKSGDLAQAVFILEEYLPQQPGHISGHIVYGQTLFELGRDEEAKRVFETALSLDPENLIALRHLGHISRQAGDFDAARSWYQRLLEADPRDAEIEQLLGSLDAAAQAHVAGLSGAPPVEAAPPSLPPTTPEPELDDSPLRIEHLVQQDAPGAPARPTTHPLPPPVPFASEERRSPADALEPPPLPEPEASAPEAGAPREEVDAGEELLDLSDFSFEMPSAGGSAQPAQEANAHDAAVMSGADSPSTADEAPTAGSTDSAQPEPAAPEEPIGFEPFSGLDSRVEESPAANVSGLESYEFESPKAPVAEVSDDVGSFYMESTTPEPRDSAGTPSIESIETDFGAGAHTEATDAEARDEFVAADASPPEAVEAIDETDVVARATVPVASTPVSTTSIASSTATPTPPEPGPAASYPFAATPAQSAASGGEPAVHDSVSDAEGDAFATETMAKLYLSQGHLESALGIYRTLLAKRPEDESLRRQVAEIEDRAQRRRREPTPPAPVTASEVESIDEDIATGTPVSVSAARSDLPTIRDFLLGIIRRGAHATKGEDSSVANNGTIDALFTGTESGEGALDDDLAAADTLAQAFAPPPEPARDVMRGQPTREATTELSLDRVFRQPTPAHAGEAAGGFSFDQFFAGERSDDSDSGAPGAPPDPDDIEQFNAWLNGLKKS